MNLNLSDVAFMVKEVCVTKGVSAWCKLNNFDLNADSTMIDEYSTFTNFSSELNKEASLTLNVASLTLSVENIDVEGTNTLCFQLCHDWSDGGAVAIVTIFVGNTVDIEVDDQITPLDVDMSLTVSAQMRIALDVFLEMAASTNENSITRNVSSFIEKQQHVVNRMLCHVSDLENTLKQASI